MKKQLQLGLAIVVTLFTQTAFAQVSTFENIELPINGYYNGSDWKSGFNSGNAFFVNEYDTAFGFESWGGFAVSNIKDSTTAGFMNQYAAITGGGKNSNNYAVAYGDAKIRVTGSARTVSGFYITNSTYAYLDMKNGSQFSKKFGGVSGNDPDFLSVTISSWKNNGNAGDTSITVYLADFRDANNANDYILNTWKWVDLSVFGAVDSFGFNFASSDTGAFGINTPVYFCMDNFDENAIGVQETLNKISMIIYPNPVQNRLHIEIEEDLVAATITDLQGKTVLAGTEKEIDLSALESGIYILSASTSKGISTQKIVKQ
jgi:hypothetical protein